MPVRKVSSEMVKKWTALVSECLDDGLSREAAYRKIADQYNLNTTTVHYHLTSGYAEKKRHLAYVSYWARRRRRDREIARRKTYRSRPGVRAARKEYDLWYHRLTRRPCDFLEPIFSNVEEADLDYVAGELRRLLDGTRFTKKAAKSVIQRYNAMVEEGRIRGPPIEETLPGRYRVLREND